MGSRKFAFPIASISTYLVLLVAAMLLPILAFFCFLVLQMTTDQHEALERRTVRDATTLALAVERQLQDVSTTLRLLSTAPELRAEDLSVFHARTQLVLSGDQYYVLLLQEDGSQLLNTRVAFGQPLGVTSDLHALERALAEKRLVVSNLFFGRTSAKWVFNVLLPLPYEVKSKRAALAITQNAETLTDLIVPAGLPPGWSGAIIDGEGQIVASGGSDNIDVNSPFPYMRGTESRANVGIATEGDQLVGFAKITGSEWKAVIWGPPMAIQSSILQNYTAALSTGVVFLLLAIVAAALIARQMGKPITQLADLADRMGRGEIVSPLKTPIKEANLVSVALTNASFDRAQTEDRLRLVVRELTHRTKNLLAIIQAIIRQTSRAHPVSQQYLTVVMARLQGMASSLDLLAREEWAGVSLSDLLNLHMSKFYTEPVQVDIAGEEMMLKPAAVHPLGLAFHELGTNSMKYGALSAEDGRVHVHWTVDRQVPTPVVELVWQERGGPPPVAPESKGFGSTIIEAHVAQAMRGSATVSYGEEGFRWTLSAPLDAFLEENQDDTATL